MKTIGLIGGITWHSTLDYYRYINELADSKSGGDESAKIILNSVNYSQIKQLTFKNDWNGIANIICNAAKKVQEAGADCILLCANTMHQIANEVQQAVTIPLIHIADATANEIEKRGLKTIALLGTKYTMQFEFFKKRLLSRGIKTLIPDEGQIEKINTSIYAELGKGVFLKETKQQFISVIEQLIQKGAQGVVLGCTEIPLLIKPADCDVPLFDTTFIHSAAAVEFAFAKK
ncbi:MAG: aspartate/glutamate racemase family protein [Ginsengibacter sp.]